MSGVPPCSRTHPSVWTICTGSRAPLISGDRLTTEVCCWVRSQRALCHPSSADGRVFRRWDDVRAFKKYWARACGLAKIQDLYFHDLRHIFPARLQGRGIDYEVRQALLGHRMPGMTATYSHGGPAWDQRYAHHYPESLRAGAEVLDRLRKESSTKIAQSVEKARAVPLQTIENDGAPGRN